MSTGREGNARSQLCGLARGARLGVGAGPSPGAPAAGLAAYRERVGMRFPAALVLCLSLLRLSRKPNSDLVVSRDTFLACAAVLPPWGGPCSPWPPGPVAAAPLLSSLLGVGTSALAAGVCGAPRGRAVSRRSAESWW